MLTQREILEATYDGPIPAGATAATERQPFDTMGILALEHERAGAAMSAQQRIRMANSYTQSAKLAADHGHAEQAAKYRHQAEECLRWSRSMIAYAQKCADRLNELMADACAKRAAKG